MPKPHYNYIIVGQGLAGTVLAHMLIARGKMALVIDDNDPAAASKVAAGIFNPIVPKRLAKSWKVDEALPLMNVFYRSVESTLGISFLFPRRMLKPFVQKQEMIQWLKKTKEDVGVFLGKEFLDGDMGGLIFNPVAAAEILGAGNIDTTAFLSASREYFKKNNLLLEERVSYSDIRPGSGSVAVNGCQAEKLIFCEGHRSKQNPWFGSADYRLTKGEVLIIQLPPGKEIPPDTIINKGVFILPLGNHRYKVGATFDWDDMSTQPTVKAREELIEKLEKVLKIPFEILSQQAGIRPTMNDRRPILGLHPEHPVLGIFNGLGTKGVMLAPYFAAHFCDFLEGRSRLDKEVDFARFRS